MSDHFQNIILHSTPRIFRCEPHWRWQVDAMPDYDLWCALSGRGTMTIAGTSQHVRPGMCWLLEPNMPCRASHDPEHRLRVFSVHLGLLNADGDPRAIAAAERPTQGIVLPDLGLLEALVRGCIEATTGDDELSDQQVILYIRQLLLLLLDASRSRPTGVTDHRIAGIHQAILEEPGRAWTIDGMARRAGLSRSRFTRLFTDETGRSPVACVLEARMQRARHLLRETTLQVQEISELLGYRDIYYFSRQFKSRVGVAPSEFRKQSSM